MATPLLDKEIVKLRRRLGDAYDTSGNLIVTSTSPGSGQIYTGNSALVATWNRDELLDCYNDAIRMMLDYVLKFVKQDRIFEYLPGYLVLQPVVDLTKSTINNVDYYYIDVDTVTPPIHTVITLRDSNVTTARSLGSRLSPDQFFTAASSAVNTRDAQIFYAQMYYTGINKNCIVCLHATDPTPRVDLVYLKQHTDLVHNSLTDLSGISGIGLRGIMLMAEAIATRYRSGEARDIPQGEIQTMMQTDLLLKREDNGTRTQ